MPLYGLKTKKRMRDARNQRLDDMEQRRAWQLEDEARAQAQNRENNINLLGTLAGDAMMNPAFARQAEQLVDLPAGQAQAGLQAMMQQGFNQTPTAAAQRQAAQQVASTAQSQAEATLLGSRLSNAAAQREAAAAAQGPRLQANQVPGIISAVNSYDKLRRVQKIHKDVGRSGFLLRMKNRPGDAKELEMFRNVDALGLLKQASGDSGAMSEIDVERYLDMAGVSVYDLMFQGGAEADRFLDLLMNDMERVHNYNVKTYGEQLGPEVFQLTDFESDWGQPYEAPGGQGITENYGARDREYMQDDFLR